MKKLKTALVGCGNISRSHFDALKMLECDITAVCDNQPERADKAAAEHGCKAYYSLGEMLKNADFDILHICTPHYLHKQMAVAALNEGKHVLCEKPMALNRADAQEMIAAADKSGKELGICFQNRYNPSSVKAAEILKSGRLGRIKGARASVIWDRGENYYLADAWRGKIATEGGGVLINQAIHTLDLMQWLIGRTVTDVKASISTKRLYDTIEVEDTADLLLTFDDNIRAVFYATLCYTANCPIELCISCENGSVLIGDSLILRENGKEDIKVGIERPEGEKAYWGLGHPALIGDFYDCIYSGRHFPVDGREAINAVGIIEQVYNLCR